jgi:hypothetical protein
LPDVERSGEHGEPKARRIELEAEELTLLLKACAKYRSSLPIYLQARQPELRLIEAIIRKLS